MQHGKLNQVLLAGALSLLLLATTVQAAEPSLQVVTGADGRIMAVEASHVPAKAALSVEVVDEASTTKLPRIVGALTTEDATLRFTPKYAFRPGITYRATLKLPAVGDTNAHEVFHTFRLPDAPPQAQPSVTAVYPSAATLPENQLKFYVHFSTPMRRGEAYDHIQLLGPDGLPVELAFLEIGEELWDGSGTRLTMLFDPGRIKRGVKPREDIGPALEEGGNYTLHIGAGLRSAAGRRMKAAHEKSFKVGPPIAGALDTAKWAIKAPTAGSREPAVIRFPRPLDRALLERTITVVRKNGEAIGGEVTIEEAERCWKFRPASDWQAGEHELVIDTVLEDLAGNRIGSAFEVDALDPLQQRIEVETARIAFRVDE